MLNLSAAEINKIRNSNFKIRSEYTIRHMDLLNETSILLMWDCSKKQMKRSVTEPIVTKCKSANQKKYGCSIWPMF
jgi:hypothetical protein